MQASDRRQCLSGSLPVQTTKRGRVRTLATRINDGNRKNQWFLLVLAIGVLILIHLCVTKRVIRRPFANGSMMVEGNGTATNASRRIDLEKLPSFDFREKEVGSSPVSCAICLSTFRGGDKCRLLPICKHSFHMEYVDEWLFVKAHCPICRGSANSIERVENTVGLDGHQNDRSPES